MVCTAASLRSIGRSAAGGFDKREKSAGNDTPRALSRELVHMNLDCKTGDAGVASPVFAVTER